MSSICRKHSRGCSCGLVFQSIFRPSSKPVPPVRRKTLVVRETLPTLSKPSQTQATNSMKCNSNGTAQAMHGRPSRPRKSGRETRTYSYQRRGPASRGLDSRFLFSSSLTSLDSPRWRSPVHVNDCGFQAFCFTFARVRENTRSTQRPADEHRKRWDVARPREPV